VSSIGHGKSPEQLTSEEAALKNRYATRAIETLKAAIDLGYRDMVQIETDSDLTSIRKDERYRVLIARLKPASKQGDRQR
jgi:hypothetical protein